MRMLIDARHPEETRVAVATGNRIEEFDFESAEHKQLKGNIYLAKVTRVEPSLQAAFIDYGGNRHGFLAFSEIHPDYYQIPKSDRDALLREEAEHAAEEERLRGNGDYYDDEDGDDVGGDYESGGESDGFADDIRGEGDEHDDEDHHDDVAPDEDGAENAAAASRWREEHETQDCGCEVETEREPALPREWKSPAPTEAFCLEPVPGLLRHGAISRLD